MGHAQRLKERDSRIRESIRAKLQTARRNTGIDVKIKPVHVMIQEGMLDDERIAILEGASEMIRLTGEGIDLADLGVWRQGEYVNSDGSLEPYKSVNWYVQRGRERSIRNSQLNADAMLSALEHEPWKNSEKGGKAHYDILAVFDDMYAGGSLFVIGYGRPGVGAVISINRFKGLNKKQRIECIKTGTMHELGHAFGLVPDSRTEDFEYSLGKHCTNKCVMRRGINVPRDWVRMSEDRLKYGALCERCADDLKSYFG